MLSLRTVEPYRLGILDPDRICQDLGSRCERSVRGHEAREEGVGLVGHDVLDRDAGVVEGGLDDGVVLTKCVSVLVSFYSQMEGEEVGREYANLRMKLKLNQVSRLRNDIVR